MLKRVLKKDIDCKEILMRLSAQKGCFYEPYGTL